MSSFVHNFRKSWLAIAILTSLGVAAVAQQKVEKSNMDLVGYNDLQARSAYQPTVHKQGNRWFAYGKNSATGCVGARETNAVCEPESFAPGAGLTPSVAEPLVLES